MECPTHHRTENYDEGAQVNWITNYFLAKNLDGLKRYVEHHIPTGGFLQAALCIALDAVAFAV